MLKSNINSSMLRRDMLRNEQSLKESDKDNKKILEEQEAPKKINDILSKVTEGTLTVEDATKELEVFGVTPQKTYQNDNEVLNIAFQGKQYSAVVAKVKPQTVKFDSIEILDSYIKDRVITVGNKAIDDVIGSAVKGSSNDDTNRDTKSYTKITLKNKYDLTENEIAHYFKKNLALYKMNYEVIDKEFPGAGIENPKDLKEVIETGVNAPEQDTNGYTKNTLINKYGFSYNEIQTYFVKKILSYKMNYSVINQRFPGAAIESPEDLKEVIECGVKAFNDKGSTDDYINGLYTNSNLSEIQIKVYIDDFAKLLKKELREKYSDDYLDTVLQNVKEEMLSNLDTTLPLRQILKNFKNDVNEFLTQMQGYPYLEVTKGLGNNKKVVNFFDEAISPQKLINNKKKILEKGDAKAQFLINFLYDTAERINLTVEERVVFFQKVFDAVAQKVGGYEKGESKLNFSKLGGLDQNNDGSWMDEFCAIVEKEAAKINPNVDRNPAKLLGSTLSNISAEDFLLRLDEFLLHDDGSVRKFAQKIDEALSKFRCYNDEEAEKLISLIFKLLNSSVGIDKTGTLHQDTIKNLNEQGNIFEKLGEIIDSNSLNVLYQIDIDEEIGAFEQGGTGDCWLLAALISMNASENGKKIISNAIEVQVNGDVKVHFKGVGVSYIVTAEEIIEAREASKDFQGPWSDGDNDVLVLELATEKLRRDIAVGKVNIDEGGVYDNYSMGDNGGASEGVEGGWPAQMIYFLTGQKSEINKNSDGSNLSQKQIENFFNKYKGEASYTTILNFSVGPGKHTATTVTGEVVTVDISTGHAFSITNIDYSKKTVTIVNPWDSSKEYTLTWAEFAKFGVNLLSAADLSEIPV